ncbi:transglycosylase SLT domain-containing protein [uncultured Methylobacterium sp.]|uniref:transglycosylase SLT domain-containing protein n=1 Tax=uncultured Methylobacterium sp. TaxID=157278 RepID=UPI0035CC61B5
MSAGFLNPMAGLGGNMPADPTGDLIARQKLAELLAGGKGRYNDTSPKQHPYQALAQVADGAFEGLSARQQLAAALAGQAQANSLLGAMPTGATPPAGPVGPAPAGSGPPPTAGRAGAAARAPGELAALFDAKEKQYGLPAGYLHGTASIETGGRFNADAHNASGADGIFQFIPSTASAYGVNTRDVASSTDGAARYARDNADRFRAAMGREPTAGELYLMHQQGEGGGLALLQNPDRPAGSLTSAKNIAANGGDPNAPASAFIAKWGSRFGGGAPQPGAQAAGAPVADLPVVDANETAAPGADLPRTPDGFAIPPAPGDAPPDDLRAQLQAAFDAKRAGGDGPDTVFTSFLTDPRDPNGGYGIAPEVRATAPAGDPSGPRPGDAAPMPQPGPLPNPDIAALMAPRPMGAPQGFTPPAGMPAPGAGAATMNVPLPPQRPSDEALAVPAPQVGELGPSAAPAPPARPEAGPRARLAQVLTQPRTDAPDPQSAPGQPSREGIVQSLMGGVQDGLDRVFGGPETQARLDAQGGTRERLAQALSSSPGGSAPQAGGNARARLAEALSPPPPAPTAYTSLPAGGVPAPGPGGAAPGPQPAPAPAETAAPQAPVQVAQAGATSSTQQQQVAWAQRVMAASASNPAVAKLVPLAQDVLKRSLEGNYGQAEQDGRVMNIAPNGQRSVVYDKSKDDQDRFGTFTDSATGVTYQYKKGSNEPPMPLSPGGARGARVTSLVDPAERAAAGVPADFKGAVQQDATGRLLYPSPGGVNVTNNLGPKANEALDGTIIKKIEESQSKAEGAVGTIKAINRQKEALDKGLVSGWGANWQTQARAAAAKLLGLPDEALTSSEVFDAASTQKSAELAKAISQAGHTTNMDLQLGKTIAGGNRETTEKAIRAIVEAQERLALDTIEEHNRKVDKFGKINPAVADRAAWFRMEAPEVYRYGQDRARAGGGTAPASAAPSPAVPGLSRADLEAEARRRGLIR